MELQIVGKGSADFVRQLEKSGIPFTKPHRRIRPGEIYNDGLGALVEISTIGANVTVVIAAIAALLRWWAMQNKSNTAYLMDANKKALEFRSIPDKKLLIVLEKTERITITCPEPLKEHKP